MSKSAKAADEFPAGLAAQLGDIDKGLKSVEAALEPIISTPIEESYHTMSPLERAKYDLVSAYAINSLFWVYLRTKGEDAKEHGIKGELDRLKSSMMRVKDIVDKSKAMRVDRPAAHRMVSKSLWRPSENNDQPKTAPKRRTEQDPPQQVKRKNKP